MATTVDKNKIIVKTGDNEYVEFHPETDGDIVNVQVDGIVAKNAQGAIDELNKSKQGNLLFDSSPTENSKNPVTSGGVFAADDEIRDRVSKLENGEVAAGKAKKLETARNFAFTGDATGSGRFDGSQDANIALTLKKSGVAAGTYSVVQVDEKGIVKSGAQLIEVGEEGQDTPSASLAIGGLFFKRI